MTFQTGKKLQEMLYQEFEPLIFLIRDKLLESRNEENVIGYIDEWFRKKFRKDYIGYNVYDLRNIEIPEEFYFYDIFPDVSTLETPNLYAFNLKDKTLWLYFKQNYDVFNTILEYVN
jgi:hypothetical protein